MQNTGRKNNSGSTQGTTLKAILGFIFGLCLTSCASIQDQPMSRADYNAAAANFAQSVQNFSEANRGYYIQGTQPRPILIQQNQAQPSYFIQTPPNGW